MIPDIGPHTVFEYQETLRAAIKRGAVVKMYNVVDQTCKKLTEDDLTYDLFERELIAITYSPYGNEIKLKVGDFQI